MPRRPHGSRPVNAQDWANLLFHGVNTSLQEDNWMPPPTSKEADSPSSRAFLKTVADADTTSTSSRAKLNHDSLGVEDLNLPRSMVQRLAKGVLPANTQIQKEALLAMSKSATVFVNYLASNANDRAVLNKKRTIQPDDVFDALDELEFPDFLPRVKTELEIWNTAQCDKRNSYRRRVKEGQSAKERVAGEGGDDTSTGVNGHRDGQDPPSSKRARLSSGAATNGDDDMIDEQDEGDDTIDENEPDEDDENIDDQDNEEDPEDDADADGLEGDMDHNAEQEDDDDDEGAHSD